MSSDTLARLRQIRDARRRLEHLRLARDVLIIEAVADGYSRRRVAQAAGVSPALVTQIVGSARK